MNKAREILKNVEGAIVAPVILYWLGAPLIVVVLLWAFFFRGR